MIHFIQSWQPIFEFMILHAGYALSQYVVLRAGVFSVATTGFAAVGAYGGALLTLKYGVPPVVSMLLATAAGCVLGLLIAVPLARLRGVYQAIATLSFVQIIVSLNLYMDGVTGGATGLNGIPKVVTFLPLAIVLAAVLYVVVSWNSSRLGRAANVVRQDEAVSASLGISTIRQQSIAFGLSGAIGGLFGSLEAFHGYALDPGQFGFELVVLALSCVVLGGRRSVAGPIVGALVLGALPELARALEQYRMLIYGGLLMFVIAYLPRGIADSAFDLVRRRKLRADTAGRPADAGAAVIANEAKP
jgi:branched-chain amino acid transport system permease protein